MSDKYYDLLVIGGGPAGAATAYWAASAGLKTAIVEKKVFPRQKTCGDGLTPRAVHQLSEMQLDHKLTGYHKYEGLRAIAHNKSIEMKWPDHPVFPSHGYVVRRCDLDTMVVENAIAAGAEFFEGMEAIRPLHDDNSEIQGALVINHETSEELEIKAKFLAVADGANSRFGRSLGSNRNKSYPMGMAIRGYFESPLDKEPWIESALDVKDRNGNSMPGYGWIFPVGNGTINVGIGLLSTFRDYREVNTTHLFNEFALTLPDYWDINPLTPIEPPTGGRLPMAGSVGPKAGHNWLLVGDAAGSVNPFNGEGIDYAYETGRLAASLFVEANLQHDNKVLQRYPDLLDEEYGLYFKVARLFAKIIGNPVLIRELTRVGMHSQTLMEWALKVMANLMKENDKGLDEAAYGLIASIVKMIPDQRVSK